MPLVWRELHDLRPQPGALEGAGDGARVWVDLGDELALHRRDVHPRSIRSKHCFDGCSWREARLSEQRARSRVVHGDEVRLREAGDPELGAVRREDDLLGLVAGLDDALAVEELALVLQPELVLGGRGEREDLVMGAPAGAQHVDGDRTLGEGRGERRCSPRDLPVGGREHDLAAGPHVDGERLGWRWRRRLRRPRRRDGGRRGEGRWRRGASARAEGERDSGDP